MAVTAHWIQSITLEDGSQKLNLRSDLIGFHKIPGRHTGVHLAYCFLYIIDRMDIDKKVFHPSSHFFQIISDALQIGWITCDNASNNNTLMGKLEELLGK